MFVKIDGVGDIEGFEYTTSDNTIERVVLGTSGYDKHGGYVAIEDDQGGDARIFVNDIPKLVKALQATEQHFKTNGTN